MSCWSCRVATRLSGCNSDWRTNMERLRGFPRGPLRTRVFRVCTLNRNACFACFPIEMARHLKMEYPGAFYNNSRHHSRPGLCTSFSSPVFAAPTADEPATTLLLTEQHLPLLPAFMPDQYPCSLQHYQTTLLSTQTYDLIISSTRNLLVGSEKSLLQPKANRQDKNATGCS
jgi:hypothetical protein